MPTCGRLAACSPVEVAQRAETPKGHRLGRGQECPGRGKDPKQSPFVACRASASHCRGGEALESNAGVEFALLQAPGLSRGVVDPPL